MSALTSDQVNLEAGLSVESGGALPHFSGLHAFSTVIPHIHEGHLANTPWLCDPYVLVAVTMAWNDFIHLKHIVLRDLRESRERVGGLTLYTFTSLLRYFYSFSYGSLL